MLLVNFDLAFVYESLAFSKLVLGDHTTIQTVNRSPLVQ